MAAGGFAVGGVGLGVRAYPQTVIAGRPGDDGEPEGDPPGNEPEVEEEEPGNDEPN